MTKVGRLPTTLGLAADRARSTNLLFRMPRHSKPRRGIAGRRPEFGPLPARPYA
jgi:hypothetical protein